jgi:glycosyltransferase involved in cell wall biosynthesis
MLLSIIIPVYNVQDYIGICLESILALGYDENEYEVIVVNDGSPDKSFEIVESIKSKFKHFKHIKQSNKGLGGARNTGINNANGEYLFFLDADDVLVKNVSLTELISYCKNNRLDVLEFGAYNHFINHSKSTKVFNWPDSTITSGLDYVANGKFANSACNKLYNLSFIKQHQLYFMEGVYIEDAPFNIEAFLKADRVQFKSVFPVSYFQNSLSITRQKRQGAVLQKFINDFIVVTCKIKSFANTSDARANRAINAKVALFTASILWLILRSKKSYNDKLLILEQLKSIELYPVKVNSGFFYRDVFNKVMSIQPLFKLVIRLS